MICLIEFRRRVKVVRIVKRFHFRFHFLTFWFYFVIFYLLCFFKNYFVTPRTERENWYDQDVKKS